MNPRIRSRMPASIGSNQASPVNKVAACVVVLSSPMAWSPPARQRRSWLVEQAGDYATFQFHHLRDGTFSAFLTLNLRCPISSFASIAHIVVNLAQMDDAHPLRIRSGIVVLLGLLLAMAAVLAPSEETLSQGLPTPVWVPIPDWLAIGTLAALTAASAIFIVMVRPWRAVRNQNQEEL